VVTGKSIGLSGILIKMRKSSLSHKTQLGLYIMMVLYLITLLVVLVRAMVHKRRCAQAGAGAVAGRCGGSFKTAVLALTTFISVFPAYAITGVPAEAEERGYVSIRWVSGGIAIGLGLLTLYPRLQRIAVSRQYKGPTDFIMDRYRSKHLQLLCNACACFSQLLFLSMQLVAFSSILQAVTLGSISKLQSMIILAVLTVAMELLGGTDVVGLCDAMQVIMMFLGFLFFFSVLLARYGDTATYGPANCSALQYTNLTHMAALRAKGANLTPPSDCISLILTQSSMPHECKPYGCIGSAHPQFLNVPSRPEQATFSFFVMSFLVFGLNPHVIHHTYLASSDHTVKVVIIMVAVAPFLTYLPGIKAGLIKASFGWSWPAISQTATAFSAVTLELMQKSFLEYLLMSALSCSALIAIMSTAGSVVMSVTNIMALEVYSRWMAPIASQGQVVRFRSVVYVLMLLAAILVGGFFEPHQFGDLLVFQNGILMQIAPAFIFGLFYDADATALAGGIVTGCTAVLAGVFTGNPIFTYLHITGAGLMLNMLVFTTLQAAAKICGRDCIIYAEPYVQALAQELFGEPLTNEVIQRIIKDVNPPRRILLATSLVLVLASIPVHGKSPGTPDDLILGVPLWVMQSLAFQVGASITLFCATLTWKRKACLHVGEVDTKDPDPNVVPASSEVQRKHQPPSIPSLLQSVPDAKIDANKMLDSVL